MVTIHLHNVIFYAHHGIYGHERERGNTFELNLDVDYENNEARFDHIEHTVDYEQLFKIVHEQMQLPTPLLEKVCNEIILKIKLHYLFVKEVRISLYKLNAPIENFKGRAGVTISRKFDA